jgi:hypothetical protein
MIKPSQIARDVRIKFNENFQPKCLSEQYLIKDEIIFIADKDIYNDSIGEYVLLKGYTIKKDDDGDEGVYINSGYAYLNQIDLEFPVQFN